MKLNNKLHRVLFAHLLTLSLDSLQEMMASKMKQPSDDEKSACIIDTTACGVMEGK